MSRMFREGLDLNAGRWFREIPLRGVSSVTGFGMPAPEKFRSGHLPRTVLPVSRSYRDGAYSGSDMDESSDIEHENNVGRHSVQSSPPPGASRYPNGCDWSCSTEAHSDLSSSRGASYMQRQVDSPARVDGYVEEGEPSDSGRSSQYSSNQVGRGGLGVASGLRGDVCANGDVARVKSKTESHRSVENQNDVKMTAVNGVTQKYDSQDVCTELPSAPPIHDCDHVISQVADHSVRPCRGSATSTDGFSIKTDAPDISTSNGDVHEKSSNNSAEGGTQANSLTARQPIFHASEQGPWYSVLAYEACIRLCLQAWARGCIQAPLFLDNECALLRKSFSLQHVLLQPEEELIQKQSTELVSEGAALKPKRTFGKMKVQVRKVRMTLDMPYGCSLSALDTSVIRVDSIRYHLSSVQSALSSGWESARKVRFVPQLPSDRSFSRHSLAYMHATAQYIKDFSLVFKVGFTTLRNSPSYEAVQETYSCQLRLKSTPEDDLIKMQVGSGETHLFLPDSLGDGLIINVYDSKGKFCGRAVVQVANVAENPTDKVRWWQIYNEPEHELVGRIQLSIDYTIADESLRYGAVAETVAYDIVLEAALRALKFQQRNLILHGPWKWLLEEFSAYYGLSDSYTRLRYLSYIMNVATPTEDCLTLVYDTMQPVVAKSRSTNDTLSYQENRLLGEIEEQVEQVITTVFENYKSLDESILSGILEAFSPPSGQPAEALAPAVKLYNLLYDVLSPEAQIKLCRHFQEAAHRRLRRHLLETDEYIAANVEGNLMDTITVTTALQKMKMLCYRIRIEIFTDIEIHNQNILPSFIDLPNLASSIYSVELNNRLRAFLRTYHPDRLSLSVAELIIATDDFQKDLASWHICPIMGGVEAKNLFHPYIIMWIKDKCKTLIDSCKDKWSGVRTQHMTTPFVDQMYDQLMEMLTEYEVIVCRWPEYTSVLEQEIADVEKAVIEALDRQYGDALAPLKDFIAPKKFGLKYVQKLAKHNNICPYVVPDELGILLNTMKRLLDVLRPKIETKLKNWSPCIPVDSNGAGVGERLGEVTVTLRAKFRNYIQAVVEKLAENTRLQNSTKIKKLIRDSKDLLAESEIRSRMQSLKDLLVETINQCHKVFETFLFVTVCRGVWDRLGQDVSNFLEDRKENRAWHKASRIAVSVLDDTFASQMQSLLGNALQAKDTEPPRSISEVRSVLCSKDTPIYKDSGFYY